MLSESPSSRNWRSYSIGSPTILARSIVHATLKDLRASPAAHSGAFCVGLMDGGRMNTMLHEPDRESGGTSCPEKSGPGTAEAAKFRPVLPFRKGEILFRGSDMISTHPARGP